MTEVLSGDEMIADALSQMLSFTGDRCEMLKKGEDIGEYYFSARGVLYTLGYNTDDAKTILDYIYENGFSYCLDHEYKIKDRMSNTDEVREIYPNQDGCYWGVDQLYSRLRCVRAPRVTKSR